MWNRQRRLAAGFRMWPPTPNDCGETANMRARRVGYLRDWVGQPIGREWLCRLAIALVALGLVGGLVAPAGATPPPHPACFGAASRDPYHPCHNPKLAITVIPTPSEAEITPNSPCALAEATINLCTFGVPAAQAAGTIALVGDSHAWHWRAAVEVAAQAMRWQALDSTRSSCPFTQGVPVLPEPKRVGCIQWNKSLLHWFRERPEISTVFTSDHPVPVKAKSGQTELAAQVAGITAAWAALPANVKHIVVIRDIPYMHEDTLTCVEGAIAKREDAGATCAIPRGEALHRDPDVVAAERLHSSRVQVVDLTQYFCGNRLCYPVVGGALVYRDFDHLTSLFAATVGPILLHSLGQLMQSWG